MYNPVKLLCVLFIMLFTVEAYGQKTTPIQINDVKFSLPGSWEQMPEADWQEAGQSGFAESHTGIIMMIAVRNYKKDEYYKPGMNGFELVKAFYTWDSEYWNSDKGIKAKRRHNEKDYTLEY